MDTFNNISAWAVHSDVDLNAPVGVAAGVRFIEQQFVPGFSNFYPASEQMQQPFVPNLSNFFEPSVKQAHMQIQQLEAQLGVFLNDGGDNFGEGRAPVESVEQQDMFTDLVEYEQQEQVSDYAEYEQEEQVSDPADSEMSDEDSSDVEKQKQQSSDPTEYEERDEDSEVNDAPEDEDEDFDVDDTSNDDGADFNDASEAAFDFITAPDNDKVNLKSASDDNFASRSKALKKKGKSKANLANSPASVAATKQYIQQQNQEDIFDVCNRLVAFMNTPGLTDEQKTNIMCSFPPHILHAVHVLFNQPRVAHVPLLSSDGLTEENYVPQIENEMPEPAANAPLSAHPPFSGLFSTKEQAKRHRKRVRVPRKDNAPDVERVKRYGRAYWTRRIYSAIIDISNITDGEQSIHRIRIVKGVDHEPADLEAAAHHVFDSAIAVHERGWRRPHLYHKDVKRGKLVDISEGSLEHRLERICLHLSTCKAMVDDVVRGGIPMALLCDNPEARLATKLSNNCGNDKRSDRLALAKAVREAAKANGVPEPKAPKEPKVTKPKEPKAKKAPKPKAPKGPKAPKKSKKQTTKKGKEKAVEVDERVR